MGYNSNEVASRVTFDLGNYAPLKTFADAQVLSGKLIECIDSEICISFDGERECIGDYNYLHGVTVGLCMIAKNTPIYYDHDMFHDGFYNPFRELINKLITLFELNAAMYLAGGNDARKELLLYIVNNTMVTIDGGCVEITPSELWDTYASNE